MFASMYEGTFRCVLFGHEYAEYVNGCPRCWAMGFRSKVKRVEGADW